MKRLDNILGLALEKLKPLYIVASEDRYILSEFKDKFVENYVDENIRDFNYTYLEDSEDFPVLLKTVPIHRRSCPGRDLFWPGLPAILQKNRRKMSSLFPCSKIIQDYYYSNTGRWKVEKHFKNSKGSS